MVDQEKLVRRLKRLSSRLDKVKRPSMKGNASYLIELEVHKTIVDNNFIILELIFKMEHYYTDDGSIVYAAEYYLEKYGL